MAQYHLLLVLCTTGIFMQYMHIHFIYMSYIFCTQMQYLKNLVSSCQLLRLVGDAAGRNVRDEDSSVSLSPDDVEP